jgi:hypothetical protein
VLGRLSEGLTVVPLTGSANGAAPVPVCVVTGEASGRLAVDRLTVAFLRDGGAPVDHLVPVDHGITGHGHGLAAEANNGRGWAVVVRCLREPSPSIPGRGSGSRADQDERAGHQRPAGR